MDIKQLVVRCWLAIFAIAGCASSAWADEHCGDLGDCRVLIEINASDGDIGFHTLFDGEGWVEARMMDPGGNTILEESVSDGVSFLATQLMTENFFESAEPPCEASLVEEEGDEWRTLVDFLSLFPAGEYSFDLDGDTGSTTLTHVIPAAPEDVLFDGHTISWEYGEDLGECVTWPMDFEPAGEDSIIGYEVVLEPEDLSFFTYSIRVPADVNKVRVPKQYLRSLPRNTPLKVEVGAIEDRDGLPGNQTFTEEDGFCNNPSQQRCEGDEDEEE